MIAKRREVFFCCVFYYKLFSAGYLTSPYSVPNSACVFDFPYVCWGGRREKRGGKRGLAGESIIAKVEQDQITYAKSSSH